jgi:outer membrane protein assembly factor BamD (BamD/ComL family)
VAVFEATPPSASSLREETVQLDRARSAIVAGDAGAGLVALDRYAAAFPRGALAQEAALLRIRALVMSGDRSRARALARSFMAARPQDPNIEELRSLLEP